MFGKPLKDYNPTREEMDKMQYALIKTSKGLIKIRLYPQDAPNTVANFAYLAESGFYDGLKFHRVIPGFMAQGGCPDGTGMGGPDWAIKCETDKNEHKHVKGTISMAHAGPNTGGSQFFICFVPCPHLDGVHTVFGGIESDDEQSISVLDKIEMQDDIKSIEIFEEKE